MLQARCTEPFPSAAELGVHDFDPRLRSKRLHQCLLLFGATFNRTSHFSDIWIQSGGQPLWMDGLYTRSVSEQGYISVDRQVVAFRDILMTNVTLQGYKPADPLAKPYTAALTLYQRSYIAGAGSFFCISSMCKPTMHGLAASVGETTNAPATEQYMLQAGGEVMQCPMVAWLKVEGCHSVGAR